MSDPAKPLAEVNVVFLNRVETYQKKRFVRIGKFDSNLLQELSEMVNEHDMIGDVELLATTDNIMHDNTKSGLLVVKVNKGMDTKYFALAGMTDP